MPHPLVAQLRFARSELLRALEGVSDEDARRRFQPMNCISWMVGHLAWHEQYYWLQMAQGREIAPRLRALGFRQPASTPPIEDMWALWRAVTAAADQNLDTLTPEALEGHYEWNGKPVPQNVGTMLLRMTYHYWYHLGESQAVRQLLGHTDLPSFVGDITAQAPYRGEHRG